MGNNIGNNSINCVGSDCVACGLENLKSNIMIKITDKYTIDVMFADGQATTTAKFTISTLKELIMDQAVEIITRPLCESSSCAVNGFCECEPINEDMQFAGIYLNVCENESRIFTGFKDFDGTDIYDLDFLEDEEICYGEVIKGVYQVFWSMEEGQWMLDCSFNLDRKCFYSLASELRSGEFRVRG